MELIKILQTLIVIAGLLMVTLGLSCLKKTLKHYSAKLSQNAISDS